MRLHVALAFLLISAAGAQDLGIAWRTDLAAARAEAEASGKPLLAVFRCEP